MTREEATKLALSLRKRAQHYSRCEQENMRDGLKAAALKSKHFAEAYREASAFVIGAA